MKKDFDAVLRSIGETEVGSSLSDPFTELFPVDGAAVSTLGPFLGTGTLSATNDQAVHIDELQFDLGEGPCWDAMRTSKPVLEPDVTVRSDRWPAFIDAIRSEGVTSIFAFPLRLGPLQIGAIDLYARRLTDLDAVATRQASLLAEQVSRTVLRQALTAVRDGEELHASPYSRRVIHQATGMVVSQLDISAEDAELVIKGHAFAQGMSMMDVARLLIDRDLAFDRDDDAKGGDA